MPNFSTHRCLVKQLPCLYALPHWSHLRSPVAAFSFLVKRVPSLALRILFFILSMPWNEDNDGPSTIALPLFSGTETWCWRLLGTLGEAPSFKDANAAFDIELRLFTAADPSATAFSTALLRSAGLVAGENVELFRRLIRLLPFTEPIDTVCECERL